MTVYDLLIDFSIASALILIGQFLRATIKPLQELFVPSSMIAGLLGFLLGPNMLKILPFSGNQGGYAGFLAILVFTIIGINGFGGTSKQHEQGVLKRVISFQLFRNVGYFMQFGIPIAITIFILCNVYPDLNPGFGLLLASGFLGGHGTAAAVGSTFVGYGWAEASDIGMTFATLGILMGILGGLVLIKFATKKGHTAFIKDFKVIGNELRTGLIPEEARVPFGYETISSVSLDTLCFHFSIILTVSGAAYMLNRWIGANLLPGIPTYTIGFLLGLAFFVIFRRTPVYRYVDKKINLRISGSLTDYLVFFGIATINLGVVVKYFVPILTLTLVGIAIVILNVYPLGYRMNNQSWFEHSIFCYGMMTGVFAIGLILLRIVDPNNESNTLEDQAMTPWLGFVEMVVWSAFPAMLINGKGWIIVVISAVVIVASLAIAMIGKFWYCTDPAKRNR